MTEKRMSYGDLCSIVIELRKKYHYHMMMATSLKSEIMVFDDQLTRRAYE